MNGTIIFGGIILFFIISGLINFVNVLHDEVDKPKNYQHREENKNEFYSDVNVIGEQTIRLSGLSESKKKLVWNDSALKSEMLEFFPNFTGMKEFVLDRVVDDGDFKEKLLVKIDKVEEQYIGGAMTGQSVKSTLSSF